MNIIPLFVMVAIVMIIAGLFSGRVRFMGDDSEGVGSWLSRYWYVLLLMLLPLLMIFGFGDMLYIFIGLFVFLVGGALFLWWFEHDFELPKIDPVKEGFRWLKKNFRW